MKKCVDEERKQMAWFLVCLSEVDKRKLFAEMGYPSLFEFCIKEFGLSESSALRRIQVARLGHRFKEVYCLIEEGFHSLSTLSLLSPVLTWQNKDFLLEESKGKPKREVQRIVQKHFPNHKPRAQDVLKPVGGNRVELRFEVSLEFEEKVKKAKELLSHKYPKGRLEDILADALQELLSQIDPELAKPSTFTNKAREHSRYIRRGIQIEVWKRDGGACTFVSDTGKRCGSRKYLEWDHIIAFAHGGPSETQNLRLLCHAHNQLEARRKFGKSYLEKCIEKQRAFREKSGVPITNPLSHRYG